MLTSVALRNSIQCNVEFGYKFSTTLEPRKTTEIFDRVGRSQDLPDAYPISSQQFTVQAHDTNDSAHACSCCILKLHNLFYRDLSSVTLCSRHRKYQLAQTEVLMWLVKNLFTPSPWENGLEGSGNKPRPYFLGDFGSCPFHKCFNAITLCIM
jgi:hypothetical protein